MDIDKFAAKRNYLIKNVSYLSGRIVEYDIKAANISILHQAGAISAEYYQLLHSIPKISREVAIGNLLKEDNLFNEAYLSNSYLEKGKDESILLLAIMDGNKTFAEFLQRRINDVLSQKADKYKNCDIIYSYEVEGVSDEKNSYSR